MDKIQKIEIIEQDFHGQKRYKCPFCELDDYNLDRMQKHITTSHVFQEGGMGPTLLDQYGDDLDLEKQQ